MDSRAASAPKRLCRLAVEEGTSAGDPVIDGDDEVGVVTSVVGSAALGWIKRSAEIGTPVEFA